MDNMTLRGIYNVIKTASAVHSQCQGTTLIFITKREFHFISVAIRNGASLDTFKFIGLAHTV